MTLQEFIDSVGQPTIAEKLKITTQAVSAWRTYRVAPPPLEAFKLIELSHGALSWEKIYDPFIEAYLKRNGIKRESIGVQLKFPF
jgi:hypothetical protein